MRLFRFFDFETNGIGSFSPPDQTPTQLAWKDYYPDNDTWGICMSYYILGATEFSEFSPRKINCELLKTLGHSDLSVINEFLKEIKEGDALIAHNIDFDYGLLLGLIQKHNLKIPKVSLMCTMTSSTKWCALHNTYGEKFPKLVELAEKLGVNFDSNKLHDAAYDTDILAQCWYEGTKRQIFK